jgi:thioredoxin reductase
MPYDVVIVGGGPAGLAGALALGRARKRALVCDAGPPRNAEAVHVHNFLTRDGTPPSEMRRIGREQLAPYDVSVRDERVLGIEGERGSFFVRTKSETVEARRVLLALGMIDVLPEIPGYRELWGKSIFQCPYCHGWEVRDRPFALLVPSPEFLEFAIFLQSWSRDLVVFTDGRFPVPAELRARFDALGIRTEERAIARLVGTESALEAVELADGSRVPRSILFARPPQRVPDVVAALGLELQPQGFVKVSDFGETSRPGIYAAGDVTTMQQGAILAAASGTRTATMLNHELTLAMAPSPA